MEATIAALLGSFIGSVSTIAVTWIIQRQETRRRITDSLINAGMKQWEKAFYIIKERGGAIQPPEQYILTLAQYAKVIPELDSLSEDDLAGKARNASLRAKRLAAVFREISNSAR